MPLVGNHRGHFVFLYKEEPNVFDIRYNSDNNRHCCNWRKRNYRNDMHRDWIYSYQIQKKIKNYEDDQESIRQSKRARKQRASELYWEAEILKRKLKDGQYYSLYEKDQIKKQIKELRAEAKELSSIIY